MKLTAEMLRQIITTETRKPKAPQPRNLSASELRHIILTEAAKLTSAQLLSEDIATLQGIVNDKVILRRPAVGGRELEDDAEVDDEAMPLGDDDEAMPAGDRVPGLVPMDKPEDEEDPARVARVNKYEKEQEALWAAYDADVADFDKIPLPAENTERTTRLKKFEKEQNELDAAYEEDLAAFDEADDTVDEAKSFSRKTLVKKKNTQILAEATSRVNQIKAVQQALASHHFRTRLPRPACQGRARSLRRTRLRRVVTDRRRARTSTPTPSG